MDAYIHAAEPDTLFEEYRSKAVPFKQQLQVNGDGLLGFEVLDIDEY